MSILDFLFKKKQVKAENLEKGPSSYFTENDTLSNLGDKNIDNSYTGLNMFQQHIKYFYDHPETLVDFEFSNRTKTIINVWIELACISIELDAKTEYKIVSHDRYFRMEFDKNNQIVFYLQYSFGFKLYKRPIPEKNSIGLEWILEHDCSEIN